MPTPAALPPSQLSVVSLDNVYTRLTDTQIDAVLALAHQLTHSERAYRSRLSDSLYDGGLALCIEDVLRSPTQRLYLLWSAPNADAPNTPAPLLGMAITDPYHGRTDIFGLMAVVIAHPARRCGWGRYLVEQIKQHEAARGCKELVLFVDFRALGAVEFYQALGFELTFVNACLAL
ncbi:MAG: GNAT family N-acetyltransferase [Aeromonas sp.]